MASYGGFDTRDVEWQYEDSRWNGLTHRGLKSGGVFYDAVICNAIFEFTLPAEVVPQKLAVLERALNEETPVEGGPAKNAVRKSALYQSADVEVTPVFLDMIEMTGVKVGIDKPRLKRHFFKVTELEIIIVKIKPRNILCVDCLGLEDLGHDEEST